MLTMGSLSSVEPENIGEVWRDPGAVGDCNIKLRAWWRFEAVQGRIGE